MKIWSVFSLVILFHFAVIGLLLFQPGCQSRPVSEPDPSITAPASGTQPMVAPTQQQLDPAFNAGLEPTRTQGSPMMSSPSRPSTVQRSEPETGLLQPVNRPVQDGFSLPPVARQYTVQKGDTLSGIARKQGIDFRSLLSANGLGKASTIYVGQTLLIPEVEDSPTTPSTTPASSGREVEVRSGDTLSRIAARNGTSVRELKALNGISGETIYVGQKLQLPAGTSSSSTSSRSNNLTPAPARSGGVMYTVKAGDTPSGIAKRYGITAKELMAANAISDPRKLYVGRELVIPGATASSARSVSVSAPAPQRQQQVMSQPVRPRSGEATTPSSGNPVQPPTEDDPTSALEALEDEDLPFVEVEAMEGTSQPTN